VLILLIILPLSIVPYGIIQDAFPVENFQYSVICIIVSIAFALFSIQILAEYWVEIIVDTERISIKRLYRSFSSTWEEIEEYGRDQPFGYGDGNWRYYIKTIGRGDKKIKICHQRLPGLERLNSYIISKLRVEKINNIGSGLIS
jgi:hypothetical protein